MKAILTLLLSVLAVPTTAQGDMIAGRMTCLVTGSRYVASKDIQLDRVTKSKGGYSTDKAFHFDYTLDSSRGLAVYLGGENREVILFEHPFSTENFKGLTPFIGSADFESNFHELSFGRFRINYSGNDQLYLKKCSSDDWTGHFVRTYSGGHFVQLVDLVCSPVIDAVDDILANLKDFERS